MSQVKEGVIPFGINQQADPLEITAKSTIQRLDVLLSGDLEVTVAATLREDSILRLIKRLTLEVGGESIKIIGDGNAISGGGVMEFYMNYLWYSNAPVLTEPPVGVATNAFKAFFSIPFRMPPSISDNYPDVLVKNDLTGEAVPISARDFTALSPTGKVINLICEWAAVSDVISAGTATIENTQLEVVSITNPALDFRTQPFLLYENTKQATLTAGATADQETIMDHDSIVPFIGMMSFDNTVRADSVFTNVKYRKNSDQIVFDMSYNAAQAAIRRAAGIQVATWPTGVSGALFDQAENGDGSLVLDKTDVKAFKYFGSHDALTSTFRQNLHQLLIKKQG